MRPRADEQADDHRANVGLVDLRLVEGPHQRDLVGRGCRASLLPLPNRQMVDAEELRELALSQPEALSERPDLGGAHLRENAAMKPTPTAATIPSTTSGPTAVSFTT